MSTATNALRLFRLFTPTYAARINAQIIHPAESIIVKPNELESALARPLHAAQYEPDKSPEYYAAQIAYGIIKGHPFMDGNKRTGASKTADSLEAAPAYESLAFFLANEYLRAQGFPGFTEVHEGPDALRLLAERYILVARGEMDVDGLSSR